MRDLGGETDPTLANFSISHDLAYIIPDLKEALQLNPGLKLMANPWSPPGWMKANGQMNNTNGAGTLLSTSYEPLANYFVKFLQGYAAQGVSIYAITPQNEPGYASAYPGMNFSESNEAAFVANNLGPAIAQAGLHPLVLGDDFNTNTLSTFAVPLMQDSAAAQYLAGTAWHCYAGNLAALTTMHNDFPAKDNYETECSAGIEPQSTAETFIQSTRNWAKTATMWNIAEDTSNGPVIPGGCSACTPLVTINQSTGAITYNHDYYVVGQFSKFVQPGAQHIASTTTSALDDVAFRNPDGSEVLVVDNTSSATQPFTVSWDGQSFSSTLPAGAIATYKWTPGGTGNTVSVTNPGNQGGTVAAPASVQVHASDSASGQTLAYSASGLPGPFDQLRHRADLRHPHHCRHLHRHRHRHRHHRRVRVGHLHLDDQQRRRRVPDRLSPAGHRQRQPVPGRVREHHGGGGGDRPVDLQRPVQPAVPVRGRLRRLRRAAGAELRR